MLGIVCAGFGLGLNTGFRDSPPYPGGWPERGVNTHPLLGRSPGIHHYISLVGVAVDEKVVVVGMLARIWGIPAYLLIYA